MPYATNHQGRIEWHDYARATATLERETFLRFRLADTDMTAARLLDSFLAPPLRTTRYEKGFGTVYTAIYDPVAGKARFIWPGQSWDLELDDFREEHRPITLA